VQKENSNQGDAYARSDKLLFQLESRLALQYPPVLRKVVKFDTIKPVMWISSKQWRIYVTA
jgi:hypothetical protein